MKNTVKELTQERALELIINGDLNTLIEETLYLDKRIASSAMKKMNVKSLMREDYEDLVATIDLSIVELTHKYDPGKGVDFVKYIFMCGQYSAMNALTKHLNYCSRTTSTLTNSEGEEEAVLNVVSLAKDRIDDTTLILSLMLDRMLTEEESRIMKSLYFEGKTVQEEADELNHSKDYVCHHRSRALVKLKMYA